MGNVSLRPDQASEGGGLIDDFDGVISDMRFIMTDYQGSMVEAIPTCEVKFDIDGEEASQMYSVGGTGDFAPDETGHGLNKLKSKSTLTKTCKFIMLVDSIVEAGFPLNKLDASDVSPLIGLDGHWLRKVVVYKGLKKKGDRDDTALLCTKINKLPWENTGKSTKGKSKGKQVDEGFALSVASIIQGVLIEHDGEIAKKNLISALFKNDDMKALDDKKEALKLASDDTFLKLRDEWKYEDGVLKME